MICALFGHRLRGWRTFTWERSAETLTFALRSCACGEHAEAKPLSVTTKFVELSDGSRGTETHRMPGRWLN